MITQLANVCRRIAQAIFVPSYVKRVAKTMTEIYATEEQEALRREKLEAIEEGMNARLPEEAARHPFGNRNYEVTALPEKIYFTIRFSNDTNNYRRFHGMPMKRYVQIRKATRREKRHDDRR